MRIFLTLLAVSALVVAAFLPRQHQQPRQRPEPAKIKTFEEMVEDAKAEVKARQEAEWAKRRRYTQQEQEDDHNLRDLCRDQCGGGRDCSCWGLYNHGCPCVNGFPPGHSATPDKVKPRILNVPEFP